MVEISENAHFSTEGAQGVHEGDGHLDNVWSCQSPDWTSDESGRRHVVVDTGFWIFGKKRLIPAGTVRQVDHDDEYRTTHERYYDRHRVRV